MTFLDEDANQYRFTWRTIQTWYYRYKNHGVTAMDTSSRADKGKPRKVTPEEVLEAINQALPDFRQKDNTFSFQGVRYETPIDLRGKQIIVRTSDGVLRRCRNLCLSAMLEAVRASAGRTIDIDVINRVLLQPHWQNQVDLTDF